MSDGKSANRQFIGRERETLLLDDLLDHIREHGAALVVHGQAGIGKSALLEHASTRAQAGGVSVFTCIGVQSEAHLPFAGLHQLLRPILGGIADLPDPQRDALWAAFGMESATPAPSSFLIALGVLNLLTSAAGDAPILVIVDDTQWLDYPSCSALAFVARRIESDPLITLFGLRDGFSSAVLEAALPELHVDGLDPQSAATLLDEHAPLLDATTRHRLLESANGNPLALIELPAALQAEQYGGAALLPPWLPLTTRLEQAFSARASELSPSTRATLLVMAANDGGTLEETLEAARKMSGDTPITEESIEPAAESGLIVVESISARFVHPLMRSALYQATGAAQRRAAHAALASVLVDQPDRAIWHRAAALIGRDEQVAVDLAAVADRAAERGADAIAVTAFERAAHLTNDIAQQGRWLIKAGWFASQYDNDLSRRLLRTAEPLDLEPQDREELLWHLESLVAEGQWTGSSRARSFVEMAKQAWQNGQADRALDLLYMVALRCFWSNADQETRMLIAEAADRISNAEQQLQSKRIDIVALSTPIEHGAEVIEGISRLATSEKDVETNWLLGFSATAVGVFDLAAQRLSATAAAVRSQGRLGTLTQVLVSLSLATRYTGNWDVAIPAAEEGTRLAQETKAPLWGAAAQALGAAVDGLRGETSRANVNATEAERIIRAASANPMLSLVQLARGATSLTAGRHAEAFEQLWRVFDPADIAYHPVVRTWAIGDLVEAAVQSNHREQAQIVLQEMELIAAKAPFPVLLAGLSLARPLLAPDGEAEAIFVSGLDADFSCLVLARERLQLAYGIWLRRHRRPMESRAPLRAAREAFDALGAAPWAERARQELRASGETSRRRELGARDLLTPQELQIALLASEGLSNREIGQRLYLSHRTVGFHLYRIFPKLGITSRAELNAALVAGQGIA